MRLRSLLIVVLVSLAAVSVAVSANAATVCSGDVSLVTGGFDGLQTDIAGSGASTPIVDRSSTVAAASSALAATGSKKPFEVSSTLDGKSVLPQRIHWLAFPKLPRSQIAKVDFLIDGKVRWIEYNAPYTYGDDGNWLVTSWLTPGMHRFSVRVKTNKGRVASDTVLAQVVASPPPPAGLDGTHWTRTFAAGQLDADTPVGIWTITIDSTGLRIKDPGGGANYIDVVYPSPGALQSRGGIWTRNPTTAEKRNGGAHIQEGNGWCSDTNKSVDFRWAVAGTTLTLTLVGQDNCGVSSVWAGDWTRVG